MAFELLDAWSTVGSVFLAIFILLVMITVHEFGHYVMGKALGFRIDEFSIGFGPALVKIDRKKSGELFAVRLLPLGGYCAFHGEDGEEDEPEEADGSAEKEGEGESVSPPKTENGETLLVTPPVGESGAPETASRKEEEKAEAAAPQDGSDAAPPAEKRVREDGTFVNMRPWKRILVLAAGAAMNYLLALLLILLCFGIYGGNFAEVTGVADDPAYAADLSLREGDILLGAEGKNFYLTSDIARAVNGHKTGDRVEFFVSRVQADGSRREERVTVVLRADVALKNSADYRNVWESLIGHSVKDNRYTVQTACYRFGFFETVGRSFVYSFKIAGSIFRVLGELFTGRLGLDVLGGPVTTVRTTAAVASQDFRSFLEIAGFIGVNLAVFNLLPIPALDGSKIVFCAIEWVRGKPISRKVEAVIHAVGFVLLIGFAILVDILQFV